jgi:hypothetical protein
MFRNFKVLLIALVVMIVAGSAYAFAAANTGIPNVKAGEGVGTVSGYAISNVAYTLNTDDASKIDKVTFTTDAEATVVKIKLVTSGSTWYSCADTATAGLSWTCDTDATPGPQATVATMTGLTIVATDQ